MIYFADVSKLNTDDPCWQPLISAVRKEKLNRCKDKPTAQLCLGAELLLCYAIKNEFPDMTLPANYRYDGKGKPAMDRMYLSFSHSGKYAACAISKEPIGVDIQNQRAHDPKALEKVLTKNQLDMIKTMTPVKQKTALYDFWTVKESLFKVTGQGSIRQPVEWMFSNAGGRLEMSYDNLILQYYNIIPGYSLGVCSAAPLSPYIFNLSIDQLKTKLCED